MVCGLILSLIGLPSAVFANATWVGGISQDWNTGANWSVNPPTGSFTINTATAGVYPIIGANSAFAPVDILVGVGVAGRVDQTAGTNSTGAGNWLIMGQNNGGAGTYNLNGGTLNAGAIHMLNNGSGSSTATLNVSGTVNSAGATVVNDGQNGGVSGTGTLNVNSGGILNSEGDLLVSFAGSGLGQVNIAAGATVNVATTTKRWLIVNEWDTTQGAVSVNGGTLNLNANTDIQFSTGTYQPGASQGTSSVTLNSGAITSWSGNQTGAGSGVINLNNDGTRAGINNTFNLNGGTLTIAGVVSGQTAGARVFNFNGGILKPTASSATFFAAGAASVANVRDNGAIIDSNGKNVTIAQDLVHSTIGGDAATDGGLTKTGNGTLTLAGSCGYSGATKVLGGTLSLNTSLGLPSPGGDLVVSNATLTLNASSGSAMSANNVSVSSTLNLALNPSANAINAAGSLTLGDNTTLNLAYGTVSGNPSAAALNASGSLTKGTNIVINISATGLGLGVVPLIAAGAGAVSTNGVVLGSLPSGVKGVLTNNTSGSLDLLITSAGQLLSWRGADALNSPLTTWDVNTSSNWYDLVNNLTKYLQYSGNTIGDNVIFGDNGFNTDGTNHVNLSVTVVPATVIFSSASPYTLTGTGGIGGSASLVLTNMNNSVYLGTSNSFTGGTVVGSGTLIITNDSALGAASGGMTLGNGVLRLNAAITNSRPVALTGSASVGVGAGLAARLSGALSGSGSLTKNDNGTLTLAGTSAYTGAAVVSAGILNLSGAVSNTSVTVGDGAGNAILNLSGNLNAQNLFVGNANSAVAAVQQTGGTVSLAGGTGDLLNVGNVSGSYGYYNASGGTLNVSGLSIGGESNPDVWPPAGGGDGILEVNGATINNDGWIVMARGGSAETGILNVYSGSLTYSGGGLGCNWELSGSDQTSIVNLLGGSVTSTNQGVNFRTVNTGILNLNGGLLKGTSVTGPATVNFNGGTLQAAASSSGFLSVTRANVYSGGGTIDDGGYAVTVGQALLAPDGYGVNAISLNTGGAGYIAPPIVALSGGTGSNATAIATVAGGAVTGFIITSRGTGYGAGDSLSVSFSGGGANVTTPTVSSVSLTPNTSGGLLKQGAGTLTLAGANTYTGLTTVTNGALYFTPNQQTPTPVAVANGAVFGIFTSSATNGATVGNLTLGSTGSATLGISYGTSGNPTNVALTAGAVTVNGGSSIEIGGALNIGTFPILRYGSLSSLPGLIAPRGMTATLSNSVSQSTLYVVVTAVGGGIVWSGTNAAAATTNKWDVNTTANWLTGATPTSYQEVTPPGDAVLFNDIGTGVVLLSNTVSPLNVSISNDSKSYTFTGNGKISGIAGLTKSGANTATLNLSGGNDYTGPTTIAGGTLVAAGGGAIGDTSAVTLSNVVGAALSVTANETIGSLAGGGAAGGNVTLSGGDLTAGGNNASTVFGGSITGNGRFIKRGSGTLALTGLINSTAELWVGEGAGDASVLNIQPGASVTGGNWFVVGRDSAAGTVNINGGSLIHTGAGSLTLGTLGTAPSGTINLNSGSLSNLVGETYLGEGTADPCFGFYNQSGGIAELGNFYVGRGDWGGSGIGKATISGGTMTVGNLEIGFGNNNTRFGTNVMTISAGATVNATGFVRLAFAGSSSLWGMLTNNGGTLNVGATALYLSYWPDGCSGHVTLNSGAINLQNNASIIFGQNGAQVSANDFVQNGGAVTFYSDAGVTVGGTGSLNLGNSGSGNHTYTLAGGVLTVPQIGQVSGNGTLNLSGGTLRAAASSTTFLQGLTAANVMTPGATIDTAGNNITIAQPLLDGDAGGGGLTKIGNGTLTLNGVNTYTGPTKVNAGTLAGTGTIAGALTNSATLAPGDGGVGSLSVNGNVALRPGSTNVFAVDGTTPANVSVLAGANVTYGGVLKIVPSGTFTAGQQFVLFSGAGAANASNFGSLEGSPGAGLAYSFTNGVLSVVTGVASNPTNITFSLTGHTLTLSWPADHLGWILQSETNLTSPNWVDEPGSGLISATNMAVNPAIPRVFYRLRHP